MEPLLAILDDLYAANPKRKVIIFTEFVATQAYLRELLEAQQYSVSVFNGRMNIVQRNEVLQQFRTSTDILISTDAGGEGLNLQFASCVINYDLPWNPMKIEQRIGRVDRIGQLEDVVAYNFILEDSVESHVREVLETKLATILSELGVDKYSDVLDSEAAQVNFTNAYMGAISDSRHIDKHLGAVEQDLRQQVENALHIQELISEEKDLSAYVAKEHNFDLDYALRRLVAYDCAVRGVDAVAEVPYAMNDPIILRQLQSDIYADYTQAVMDVHVEGATLEPGIFTLWELSLTDDVQDRRFLPMFVSAEGIYRPVTSTHVWQLFVDERTRMMVTQGAAFSAKQWQDMEASAKSLALDVFMDMKVLAEQRFEEHQRKILFALGLRMEASERIGIPNIRNSRQAMLQREKNEAVRQGEIGIRICPEFRPVLICRME